ncbi:ATP-dependent DNA ligase [Xaviernesmea oryzae]|uniref:DNA ligase (ATP) n=1 Tax=Xaviernesmea oryzae TaxID=464029 RepID=A0A1Q9AZ35_9HYPH|nr:cisplatin damage response ATP-dependent DNA ligase [Xaviernesmea oryzae]OLP60967.1 ATP-dependent DNA ligase [Xaviernesmea oryzae]SEL19755.1 DNA ligase-1 [Xaviernesmea oryzae]
MQAFAELLDRLVLTPQRNAKIRLMADYFRTAPDPDRGYALAAIAGTLDIATVKPALLRQLMLERMDPILFQYSYDYVGDLAETISLVWETVEPDEAEVADLSLGAVIHRLQSAGRGDVRGLVRDLLDRLDGSARYAFLKLVTGSMRIGVSARLVKQALADMGGVDASEIETLWHGLEPPYLSLFSWLEGHSERPALSMPAVFHAVMLATPVADGDLTNLDPQDYAAEWKWDGIRVQLANLDGTRRLYSRSGDDISAAFPDILEAVDFEGIIDGELLVGGTARTNRATRTFSDLQQRLNRKTVTRKTIEDYPAFVRGYDLLFSREGDMRPLPFSERRAALSGLIEAASPTHFDLSPLVSFSSWKEIDQLRIAPPDPVIEGIMLKRWDSPYQSGRAKGPWFKWKREPYNIDAVLMYAQRGHGKRSSYYSDFTFGVWTEVDGKQVLVPVGKAYFGFTDAELEILDRFVRNNTVERFGPVRSVRATADHGFVLEIAFEGINRSTRHKSGVAMRFPRIARLRADKLPRDADRLETLMAMIPAGTVEEMDGDLSS